jgi:hypothetical protein
MELDSIKDDPLFSVTIADTNLLPAYQQAVPTLRRNLVRSDSSLNVLRLEAAVFQTRLYYVLIK